MWLNITEFKFRMPHVVGLWVLEATLIVALPQRRLPRVVFSWLGQQLIPSRCIMPFTSVKLSLLIMIEMLQPSTVSEILEWVVLRYLGKISFSVYLLHVFVIYTHPIQDQTNYYDRTLSIFALVILLATVSFQLVERPSQLLAQRISRKLASLTPKQHETSQQQRDTSGHGC